MGAILSIAREITPIKKTSLPSKGYQKHYLPKDIKNFTFQRISKTIQQ
jgi:hypothetical protein